MKDGRDTQYYVLEYSNIDEHWNAGVFNDLELAKKNLIQYCKDTEKILDIIIYPKNQIFEYDIFDDENKSDKKRMSGWDIVPFDVLPEWAKKIKSQEIH